MILLDPALRARVAESCRRHVELPPGLVPAVMDARGEGVVSVRMKGATEGGCDALQITASGVVVAAGGGWGGGAEPPPAPDAKVQLLRLSSIGGGGLPVEGWSVHGQAGAAIAVVQVTVPDGLVVTATLDNGWFSAWWPAIIPDARLEGDRFPHVVLRGFDRTGALVDSTTLERELRRSP